MKMLKEINPVIVVVVLVLGLGVAFGAQYAIKTFRLEEPFKAEVLSIEGVENVELTEMGQSTKVVLTLNSDAELKEVYQRVNGLASEIFDQPITIEMDQKTSADLKQVYEEMHFAIYEGIASGKFTNMSDQLKEIGTQNELDEYQVQVDNDYVYLKLVDQGQVYCQVISRGSDRLAYMKTEGGESQW